MAQGLEVDMASQGDTECAALEDLREVLELHFQPPRPTVAPRIKSVEFEAL